MNDLIEIENPRTGHRIKISRAQAQARGVQGLSNQNQQQIPEMGKFMSGITGFNTAFERIAQGAMQPLFENGLLGKNAQRGFQNTVHNREQQYNIAEANNPKATMLGNVLGNVGVGIPFQAGGTALAARYAPTLSGRFGQLIANNPYLRNVVGGGIGGGLEGLMQYVNQDESRLGNAAKGATIGSALNAVIPGMGHLLKGGYGLSKKGYQTLLRQSGNKNQITKEMLQKFTPEEMQSALKNQLSAKRMGMHLTPSEAADNPLFGAVEGDLGRSPEGARNLFEFKRAQQEAQKAAIKGLQEKTSPESYNASQKVRTTARKAIKNEEEALQEAAQPYYKESERVTIPANRLNSLLKNDGNIEEAFKKVTTSSEFRKSIKGFPSNSIKVLDEVKKQLDDKIALALRKGQKARVKRLQDSKESLLKHMDNASEDYGKARSIYTEKSPEIDLLRNREVGKIAKLKDVNIKLVPKIIFDPGQTDLKALSRIRDTIYKEDPEAWNTLIRNELSRRAGGKNLGKTGHHGSNFYSNVLSDEATYNQFLTALKTNPKAQYRLKEMKSIFKNLINQTPTKGEAVLSKTSINKQRSTKQAFADSIANLTGGKYDQAMINIITTDAWEKAFKDAIKKSSEPEKVKALSKILNEANFGKINRANTGMAVGNATATEGEPLNINVPLRSRP